MQLGASGPVTSFGVRLTLAKPLSPKRFVGFSPVIVPRRAAPTHDAFVPALCFQISRHTSPAVSLPRLGKVSGAQTLHRSGIQSAINHQRRNVDALLAEKAMCLLCLFTFLRPFLHFFILSRFTIALSRSSFAQSPGGVPSRRFSWCRFSGPPDCHPSRHLCYVPVNMMILDTGQWSISVQL